MNRVETTVFELAGPDRPGLLAEVTHLLTHNGCNIRSAAVSAAGGRRGATLAGRPAASICSCPALQRLRCGLQWKLPPRHPRWPCPRLPGSIPSPPSVAAPCPPRRPPLARCGRTRGAWPLCCPSLRRACPWWMASSCSACASWCWVSGLHGCGWGLQLALARLVPAGGAAASRWGGAAAAEAWHGGLRAACREKRTPPAFQPTSPLPAPPPTRDHDAAAGPLQQQRRAGRHGGSHGLRRRDGRRQRQRQRRHPQH